LAVVSPAKPKATIEESSHGLEIVIPARRNWFITLFLGLWLCGWAMGEVMVPATFFAQDADPGAKLFVAVWFVAWTLGGGFALYVFFWSLVGRERILLTPSTLSIRRELFGLGRLREYELTHIRDLRASPSTYNPFDFRSGLQFWGIGGGVIAFDHGAATVRFGAALEEGEANTIIERIRSRASLE
jgi:hypothetical protein